jgi:protein-disulfide isomerase-like protein with CxxC motif
VTATARISATLHTDPGCPWAYSAIPALRVVEWRYGGGLDWRLVMIGLAEDAGVYAARGYTPATVAEGHREFRDRFGMPFDLSPKRHVPGTGRACRAVVAAGLARPGAEWAALRAIQLAWFTTPMMLDDDADLAAALAGLPGLDARAVAARFGDHATEAAYQAHRAEARTAAGSPAEAQGKTATTDGPVRFTAPTLVLEAGGRSLVAGGWQSAEVYDVLVANLAPGLPRCPAPDDPAPLLERFPEGLVTAEVAALLARGNDAPDRGAAEAALLRLVAQGRATRAALGQDALWRAA